ncbi:hypothetical protein V1478_012150 [Vespula squamosa]|uniref:Uncharacterized protein n=1 Tax=Vespula squamosa TaxID=30214 RepID=A0ABD2ACC9_VESSQ
MTEAEVIAEKEEEEEEEEEEGCRLPTTEMETNAYLTSMPGVDEANRDIFPRARKASKGGLKAEYGSRFRNSHGIFGKEPAVKIVLTSGRTRSSRKRQQEGGKNKARVRSLTLRTADDGDGDGDGSGGGDGGSGGGGDLARIQKSGDRDRPTRTNHSRFQFIQQSIIHYFSNVNYEKYDLTETCGSTLKIE